MKRKTLRMAVVVMMVAIAGFCAGWCLEQSSVTSSMTIAAEEKEVPVYFVETDEKKIAISFDAAWGCERTEKILDTLEKYNVKATFFLTNIWLDDYPEMAKKIATAGHEIAMHSVSHPHMSQISAEEVARELDGNYQRIVEVTGYTPELFRFPFGEYDNKSIDVVRAKGFYPIQWSIDTLDIKRTKAVSQDINMVHGFFIWCK